MGQSFRKPLYHCFSSCSLNSVLFTRSSITSGVSLLFCFPMVPVVQEHVNNAFIHARAMAVWTSLAQHRIAAFLCPLQTRVQRVNVWVFLGGVGSKYFPCAFYFCPSLCQSVACVALTWIIAVRADPIHQMFRSLLSSFHCKRCPITWQWQQSPCLDVQEAPLH